MNKLLKLVKWFDDNVVKMLLAFFIFLVPLWPKLPIRMIDYTYIAVRAEDIYLAVMALVFLVQLLRRKVKLNRTFLLLFIGFWAAVFISALWSIYISKTVVLAHLGFLHALRRVEYMTVFLIAASVVKNKKDFFQLLKLYFLAIFLVILYGLGQKFFNLPAVQTMNPEYAKGYLLYLTPEARLSSTFAGHYDLASYLVLAIPIILAFYFYSSQKRYLALFIGALLILIYTSSRVSFGAYAVATLAFLILIRRYWFTLFVVVLTAALVFITGDLTNRFLQTFQVRRILVDEGTGAVYIGQTITTKELPAGSFYVKLGDQSKSGAPPVNLEQLKKNVLAEKIKEASDQGRTLTDAERAQIEATLSANLKPVNTVLSDISFATRLQVEWPRAISAFKKNPLLGTGPSSITEATDNDYLRWLGEFGLLGTIAFLAILFTMVKKLWFNLKKIVQKERILVFGFIFGLGALLINATYIDVFEASKVAHTFWLVAGIFVGGFLNYEKS